MAFPNLSDIAATTIDNRARKLVDNIIKNNALLTYLEKRGNVRPISGGDEIVKELIFAENGNFAFYSGLDQLSVGAADVITAAKFPWKQAACAVVMSGREKLQNMGKERQLDLLEGRINAAETTMANNICGGLYSDGTAWGGKQIGGLAAIISATGTVGGIDRSQWSFWAAQSQSAAGYTKDTIQGFMNDLWVKCVVGMDRPDLILMDDTMYATFLASLQSQQRFTTAASAEAGFANIKFMGADVVLDGGIGGFCPANTAYFVNTKHVFYQPHKDRNMNAIAPDGRAAVNQDATVSIIGWMGNMTADDCRTLGVLNG